MNVRSLNTITFFAFLLAASYGAYTLFAPFLHAIFAAAVLAILFYPLYERVCSALHGRTYIAATILLVGILLLIIVPITVVSTMVVVEVAGLVQSVSADPGFLRAFSHRIDAAVAHFVPGVSLAGILSPDAITQMTQRAANIMVAVVQKTYTGIAGGVIGFFVLFFTLFYFFVDGARLMRRIMMLSPLPDKYEKKLFADFSAMSRATIKGTLIIGLIQGSLGAMAFAVVGIPNILLWWISMVFLAIIPLLGVGIIGFPVAAYYLISGDFSIGGALIAAFVTISLLDNYLRPLIVGRDVQMHTLLVFFATLGGIMSFGLLGFIIGPIIMALALSLWQIYAIEFREQLARYNRDA